MTTHPNVFTGVRRSPSGLFAAYIDGKFQGRRGSRQDASDLIYFILNQEPELCGICDGQHGGICPLEDRGEDDPQERALWALEDARRAAV